MSIDLTKLSPEELADLNAKIKEQQQAEKNKLKQDKETLQEFADRFLETFVPKYISSKDALAKLTYNEVLPEFEKLKELKNDIWGEKSQKNYSHTFTSSDKKLNMTVGYNTATAFDGTYTAGVIKIQNVIALLDESKDKIAKLAKSILDIMLKVNIKTGELNADKALELNKIKDDFESEEFNEGVDILLAARYKKITSLYVDGWQEIEVDGHIKTLKFRFSF